MKAQAPAAGELLREVARLYTRAQRSVADGCGTTGTQCHLLMELGRTGPLPLVDLGQRLCLEKSWVSRAVDGLVDRGLATKEPNPQDARSWLVTLTAEGEARVQALNHKLDQHAARLLAALGDRQRAQVGQSLRLVLNALRESTEVAARAGPPASPVSPAPPAPRARPACR